MLDGNDAEASLVQGPTAQPARIRPETREGILHDRTGHSWLSTEQSLGSRFAHQHCWDLHVISLYPVCVEPPKDLLASVGYGLFLFASCLAVRLLEKPFLSYASQHIGRLLQEMGSMRKAYLRQVHPAVEKCKPGDHVSCDIKSNFHFTRTS